MTTKGQEAGFLTEVRQIVGFDAQKKGKRIIIKCSITSECGMRSRMILTENDFAMFCVVGARALACAEAGREFNLQEISKAIIDYNSAAPQAAKVTKPKLTLVPSDDPKEIN